MEARDRHDRRIVVVWTRSKSKPDPAPETIQFNATQPRNWLELKLLAIDLIAYLFELNRVEELLTQLTNPPETVDPRRCPRSYPALNSLGYLP